MAWLPDTLPATVQYDWSVNLAGEGIGGIAVGGGCVVVGSRDALDHNDVFQCFDADDGALLWQHVYPALGRLDYGNSPRATPVINGEYVDTLGAFGQLCCLELESGLIVWQLNIAQEFQSPKMIWGHSGSPLLVDDKLIVQPGGGGASLVALDAEFGDVVWKSAGDTASYSSFVVRTSGNMTQVIGLDEHSIGGWDATTGERLWSVTPAEDGDFNVPTPVLWNDKLILSSENNGTRLHEFHADGTLNPQPLAVHADLKPDSHTPVVSGNRLFGICSELIALDLTQGLKATTISDDAFAGYGSLIASDSRVLALTVEGELLLVDSTAPQPTILSRLKLTTDRKQILSHPAVAGDSLYVRIGTTLNRLKLTK